MPICFIKHVMHYAYIVLRPQCLVLIYTNGINNAMFIISIEGGSGLIKSLKTIIGQIFRRLRYEFVSNTHIYIIVSERSRKTPLTTLYLILG